MLFGYVFQHLFNPRVKCFDDPAAFSADQMVVLPMFVFVLKTLDAIPKTNCSCQPCIRYCFHCPVHSGKTYFGVFFSDKVIKVVNRKVFFGLEEYIQDLLSLFAVEHTVFFKILTEYGLC